MEKWYIYRNPITGQEVRVIVKKGDAIKPQLKTLQLSLMGFKCVNVVYPSKVQDCKSGGA